MVAAASSSPVLAQGCLEFVPPLIFDTSENDAAKPSNPRVLGTEVFNSASGSEYLMMNTGNELSIWKVDNPRAPVYQSASRFGVEPFGDRDYNLFKFDICDGCRFGIAGFDVQGTVVFDLGTGEPGFRAAYAYSVPTGSAITFRRGADQYLVASGLPGTCGNATRANATLYRVTGVDESGLENVGCIQGPNGAIDVLWGQVLDGTTTYLYLMDRRAALHVMKVSGSGSNVSLEYVQLPTAISSIAGYALDVEPDRRLLTTAASDGIHLWDISNPAQPVQRAVVPSPQAGTVMDVATIRGDAMYTTKRGLLLGRYYDISAPQSPQMVDEAFFATTQPWNSYDHMSDMDGAFSKDAQTLFLARYSVGEVISAAGCGGGVAPTAVATVTPAVPFPGDEVVVTNASGGAWTHSAIWIESGGGPTPGSGTWEVGHTTLQLPDSPDVVRWTPAASEVLCGTTYRAFVAVESAEFPCDPFSNLAACGSQLATRTFSFDCAPEARFTISPTAAITGDAVALDGTASEGHPVGYTWQAWRDDVPLAPPAPGAQTTVTLSGSGDYRFELTAAYDHSTLAGAYADTYELPLNDISSVAADFTISPNPAYDDDEIVLNAGDGTGTFAGTSRWQEGANVDIQWTVDGAVRSACAGAQVCRLTLPHGSHTASLQLTNGDDVSTTPAKTIDVRDSSVVVTLACSPSAPEIGAHVTCQLTGLPTGVESVAWNFGGVGCDGSQTETCVPGPFGDCSRAVHDYAAAGTKSVNATINLTGGQQVVAPTATVTVQNTGTCGGGGGSCSYSVSPTTLSFAAAGESKTVQVSTGSTCTWTASEALSWLQFTGGTGGTGSGQVTVRADANSGSARSGSITVAGRGVGVSQNGSGGGETAEFTISDTTPDIGQPVVFEVTSGDTVLSWNFGGVDCAGTSGSMSCSFNPSLCREISWKYRDSGPKTVTLTTASGAVTKTLNVGTAGSCGGTCDAPGAPSADFSITPESALLGESVVFADASTNEPESWTWRVTLGGVPVKSAETANFTWTPEAAGVYSVQLTVRNCAGNDAALRTLTVVEEAPITSVVVPSVARTAGSAGSYWKTDMRLFNPTDETISLKMMLQPSGYTSTWDKLITLQPRETFFIEDVIRFIVPAAPDDLQGALLLDYGEALQRPIVVSRTYTSGSLGSYGQFIPVVPVVRDEHSRCYLPGLSQTGEYRTNIGITNLGDDWLGSVEVTLLAPEGNVVATTTTSVPIGGTRQFSVRQLFGIDATEGLDGFTVRVDAGTGSRIRAYASVVHNVSNDPVLFLPGAGVSNHQVIPGVGHLYGANDSTWRTDLSLVNPNPTASSVVLTYLPDSTEGDVAPRSRTIPLEPNQSVLLKDVLQESWWVEEEDSTKGCLLVDSPDGDLPPVVDARTYTSDGELVYGQGITVLDADSLGLPGEKLYIPGVLISDEFRTNIGLLNRDDENPVWIGLALLDERGEPLHQKSVRLLAGEFRQTSLASLMELSGEALGTLEIEIAAGTAGAVAAYASIVDNLSNDPMLIPATRN